MDIRGHVTEIERHAMRIRELLAETTGQALDGSTSVSAPKPAREMIHHMPITDEYKLGDKSLENLSGVKERLQKIVLLAIRITEQDFTVFEGLRSQARQRQLVADGFSRTMKSKHLPQAYGKSHAVDLVPWIEGKPVWDWEGCYQIARAMDAAATHLGWAGHVRWGGAWDRVLEDFGGRPQAYAEEVQKYKDRHAGADFIDGPHFEWVA